MELVVVLLLALLHPCLPYFITVDAHAEECFFDKVQNGTKLGKGKIWISNVWVRLTNIWLVFVNCQA